MRGLIHRLAFLVVADTVLINVAVMVAFWLRFEGRPPAVHLTDYERVALVYTALSLLAFYLSGLYSSLWRYASVDEISIVLKGTAAAAVVLGSIVYAIPQVGLRMGWGSLVFVEGFPRSVVLLSWLLNIFLIGGLRYSYRYARRLIKQWRQVRPAGADSRLSQRHVLVVGAGDAGALVMVELLAHPELGVAPVGFVDDDVRKQGLKIHGLPVLGTCREIGFVVERFAVDEVIIAMPSAPGRVIREIVSSLADKQVKIKTLPGIYELLNGSVSINQIREVQVEDLLGRAPVNVNLTEIAGYLRGERVLVTGAGGSIGSELCRQVARFEPAELILLDHAENGVFEISLDLEYRFPNLRLRAIVADIRERDKIFRVMSEARPHVVFHAAAHKHVPLMEHHPDEAVKTNVFGTRNVAEAAIRYGNKRFVLISTDKAVNPANIMGATKRVAEMIVQGLDERQRREGGKGTRLSAVRFGNVLGSRGSVVPTFMEQIARGGPVTVTHPDMRRYFMTIPEAVQLVIQAGAMSEGGEIFVLDMGEPVRILELAENMIRLSGFEPGVDIPIKITGQRPGEKLFEELLTDEEGTTATRHQRIFTGRNAGVEPVWLERQLVALGRQVEVGTNPEQLLGTLGDLVPNLQRAQAPGEAYRPAPAEVGQPAATGTGV